MKRSHESIYFSPPPLEWVIPRCQRNIGEEVEEVVLKLRLFELDITIRVELIREERCNGIPTPFTTLARTRLDHKPEEISS